MSMRHRGLLICACLSAMVFSLGHSQTGAFSTPAKSDDLCLVVGQPVTLRGEFSLRGKTGPFVLIGDRAVYLIARGEFTWGRSYESMEGRLVTLTGTLRFYKSPPVPAGPIAVGRLPDHYYMEAESARVELVK
jgi:hypothetical protein